MMTTKTDDFLLSLNIVDLIQWVKENQSLIYHHVDTLMKRMSDICQFDPVDYGFDRLLHALYEDKESVSEIEFNLIEEAMSNINANMNNISPLPFTNKALMEEHKFLHLFLLFSSSYDIINNIYQYSFVEEYTPRLYQNIMDVYIPNMNPKAIISLLHDNFTLKEMLMNAHNTNWFIKVFKEKKLDEKVHLHPMLLLFKYISDIYVNREEKLNFFFRLQQLILSEYSTKDYRDEIYDRYEKYFKNDTNKVINSIITLFENHTKDDNSLDISAKEFVMEYSPKYGKSVNVEIIKCLMNDVSKLCTMYSNSNLVRTGNHKYQVLLNDIWGIEDLDHVEVEPVDDEPFSLELLKAITNQDIATEAIHKDSPKMNDASKKIYKAYRNYKSAEEKVDSQITKALHGIKNVLTGDVRSEIIEGKKFSAIGLLKKLLGTVAIFSTSKIAGIVTVVTSYALKKSTTVAERRRITMELETEITLIDEKIRDARGDDNREAKYAMMRTKSELENALKKIKYGMEADKKSLSNAKAVLNDARG